MEFKHMTLFELKMAAMCERVDIMAYHASINATIYFLRAQVKRHINLPEFQPGASVEKLRELATWQYGGEHQ